jgi:hypothetical protein
MFSKVEPCGKLVWKNELSHSRYSHRFPHAKAASETSNQTLAALGFPQEPLLDAHEKPMMPTSQWGPRKNQGQKQNWDGHVELDHKTTI